MHSPFPWAALGVALAVTGCSFASRPPVQSSPVSLRASRAPARPLSQVLDPRATPEVDDVRASEPSPGPDASAGLAPARVSVAMNDESAAYTHARPVFERYCFSCHTTHGAHPSPEAIEHLAMDAYPFGGHHGDMAGDAVREALGQSGGAATMPEDHPGTVQGADLAAVLAWADAFQHAHAAPAQHHHHHGNEKRVQGAAE